MGNRIADSERRNSASNDRRQGATAGASQSAVRMFFGYGTIEVIEGNKLEIEFEHAGRKRVLDSFVSLG